ncbi:helix-turn-helix transcriptional regulator [Oribacterium sp. HCP28S3_H8]|uniref:helix-turn-helix transcriptional regulator n=1 Tax=Oribacterium sp. HCP28S3_H8 TaxID=3438945 RepID=UPI003F88DD27
MDIIQDKCILYESQKGAEQRLQVGIHWDDVPTLLYFKSGQYNLTINMVEHEISDECFAFINAGDLYKLESLGDETGEEFAIPVDLAGIQFREDNPVQLRLLRPLMEGKLHFPDFITVSDLGFLMVLHIVNDIIQRYHEEGRKQGSIAGSCRYTLETVANQLILKSELLKLIGKLDAFGLLREVDPAAEEDRQVKVIKDSVNYIREHYHEKIYIHDLSQLTDLNEQYFIRFFGSVIGISPLEYINRYRIQRAAELLRTTDKHAYEIAEACGFHNIGNFIKIFRSIIGVTPHRYRKNFGIEVKD